jgi:hypothetical protein
MRYPTGSGARAVFAGFLLLLINSAYLGSFSDPTRAYFVQVAIHPLLGIVKEGAGIVRAAPFGASRVTPSPGDR